MRPDRRPPRRRHTIVVVLATMMAGCTPRLETAPATGDDGIVLVAIDGGTFVMGDLNGEPNELPKRVTVGPFRLMKYEVTNRQFAAFVRDTHYKTDPEKRGFGMVWQRRWRKARGATWRHPRGPTSTLDRLDNHPVVQVSATDAAAFCRHHGLRLPTEPEWEFAARGATDQRPYPWGQKPPEQPSSLSNFGTVACCAADDSDGYATTAPVGSFPAGASPFGIHDMAGNVWEWTSDTFLGKPGTAALRGGGWGNNPHCLRVSYRHGNDLDIGRDHIGIRCAGDAQ